MRFSRESRFISGLLLITVPAIMYGGNTPLGSVVLTGIGLIRKPADP